MRTETMVAKLWRFRKWLKVLLISQKRVLNSREVAIYLKTTLRYVYKLVGDYSLPAYKNKQQLLYFRRKEIDAWLRQRKRKDFAVAIRKPGTPLAKSKNGR